MCVRETVKGSCGADVESSKIGQLVWKLKCTKRPNVTIYGFQASAEESMEKACKECRKRGFDRKR